MDTNVLLNYIAYRAEYYTSLESKTIQYKKLKNGHEDS